MATHMALVLDIDGKEMRNPSSDDIENAFESLERGTGWFRGPGISLVTLSHDSTHHLTAMGTYDSGFALSYQDGDPEWEYWSDIEHPAATEEVIQIFQKCARGEEWGRSNFRWEQTQAVVDRGGSFRRILLICVFGFIAYLVIRKFMTS